MGMFGPKLGSWTVSSKKDPRWNAQGEGYGLVTSGGPSEIYDWIEECKKKFGEQPDDLSVSFHKY